MAGLHIGAAVLFIANLDVYTTKLRRAYYLISIGTVIVGLGMLQVSVIAALDAWRSAYVLGGGMMFPFLIAGLIEYFGIRLVAILVKVKHPLTKVWLALPLTLLIAFGTSFLPHVTITLEETGFDIGIGIIAWAAALLFVGCILTLTLRRQAGALYIKPMTWLAGAFFVSGLTLSVQCVYYLITTDYDHIVTRINNLIAIGSGLMWLRAGYGFMLTKYYKEDISMLKLLFGQSSVDVTRPQTVVDMITSTAGLASNSQAIDPLLDDMRAITAKLKPGEQPSSTDAQSIVSVYLKLEKYLTKNEPLRTFTQQELRARLDPKLQKLIETHTN